jgi:thiamine biosynthesis protein ThiI
MAQTTRPGLIVIHFGEIWLKGENRKMFIKTLERNIGSSLKGESYSELENDRDRLLLHLDKKSNSDHIKARLSKVFGISWIASTMSVKSDMKSIVAGVVKASKGRPVRVEAHRASKSTDFTSYDIVSNLIKLAGKSKKIRMDKDAEETVYVSVKSDITYISFDKTKGAQGLPVGSSGKAVILLSGGIDSPVSAFYAMKRGLEPIYLHVHGFSSNKAKELSKIKETVKVLSSHSASSAIYYVPAHVFQAHTMSVDRKYELVLFKRFMYRLAERVAHEERADCIVTGESLGQVASQTIENLEATSFGIKSFVMRPLIGMDKQEIVDMAKRIGTFELSIKPYKDVCSISVKRPALRARRSQVDRLYSESGMGEALEQTISKSSKVSV